MKTTNNITDKELIAELKKRVGNGNIKIVNKDNQISNDVIFLKWEFTRGKFCEDEACKSCGSTSSDTVAIWNNSEAIERNEE